MKKKLCNESHFPERLDVIMNVLYDNSYHSKLKEEFIWHAYGFYCCYCC